MKINSIVMHNFVVHKDTTLKLPAAGIVHVRGSNGSGKSLIIEAVSVALWGQFLRSGGSYKAPNWAVAVSVGSPPVLVTRGSAGGFWDGAPMLPSAISSRATKELLSFHVWRRACVLSSQDITAFSAASDTDRKAILEECLGLASTHSAYAGVVTKLRAPEISTDAIQTLRQKEFQHKLEGEIAKKRVLEASNQLLAAEDGQSELLEEIAWSEAKLLELEASGIAARSAHTAAVAAAKDMADSVRRVEARLRNAAGKNCSLCGSELSASNLDPVEITALEVSRRNLSEAEYKLQTDVSSRMSELLEITSKYSALKARLANCKSRVKSLADLEELERVLQVATMKRKESQAGELSATEHIVHIEKQRGLLQSMKAIFGPTGVPAYITGAAITKVTEYANMFLGRLGTGLSIDLTSTTTLSSGESRNKIDIVVRGAGGGSYDRCSGGQRRRIDVAILLGLNLLASSLLGPGSTLFLDEVFDTLDADGIEAFASVLQELAEERCILLISHRELPFTPAEQYEVTNGTMRRV